MSARRHLVSRSRQNEESSPIPRSHYRESQAPSRPRQRDSIAPARGPTPLSPYVPPSCPLTESAKRELDQLRLGHDYTKYDMHLKASTAILTGTAGDANERLFQRREEVKVQAEKRRRNGDERTEEDIEMEKHAERLEIKVGDLTQQAEKALREMLDYRDELSMNDTIMRDIQEQVPQPPPPQPVRLVGASRVREAGADSDNESQQSDQEEPKEEIPEIPEAGISVLELLRKAKRDHATNYSSKSMRVRYENTDYLTFKRTVHDARHGDDAPPVPHARTWFPEDQPSGAAGSRRLGNSTDNTNNGEGTDDDLFIAKATTNLKCPLTLQYFKEPYSSRVCQHSFEKFAIIDYHRDEAVSFIDSSQPRRAGATALGPKRVKCPQTGCNAMLGLEDFYDDLVILRQLKRAQNNATREGEDEDEDDYEDDLPKGTQRSRPEEINSDAVEIDEEEDAEQRRRALDKIKEEGTQSRGISMAPSRVGNEVS